MHGSVFPPRPHLFGHKRQERREQPVHGIERQQHRAVGRRRGRLAVVAVPSGLDELQIVVAEKPEKTFRALERRRVLVIVQRLGRGIHDFGEPRQHAAIGQLGDRTARFRLRQHELRCVQQLDGKPAAHAHLARVKHRVGSGPPARRPVPHAVGAMLFEQREGRDDIALRFRHLFSIRVGDKSRNRRVRPRQAVMREVRSQDGGKQPRTDNVVALRTDIHWKQTAKQIVIFAPARRNLRRQR